MTEFDHLRLLFGLVCGVAVTQLALLALARSLGVRLRRTPLIVSHILGLVFVASYLLPGQIMFPTSVVARAIPDATPSTATARHEKLNDSVFQLAPWELEVRRAMTAGVLPLWSDRIDGGSSPWVNPQAEPVSPTATLARLVPVRHHYMAAFTLKLLIAFQGAWLLACVLGARRIPAILGGLTFSIAGGVTAWSSFPPSATAAWLPWLVLGAIRVVRRPSPLTVAATALITTAVLLSGHPETAAGGGLLAALCTVSFCRRSEGLRGALRGITTAMAAAVIGFMMAAPHLLPFAKNLPHTVRYHRMSHVEEQAPTDRPLVNPKRARWLMSTLNPRPFGNPPFTTPAYIPMAGAGYAGLLVLAGAAIALASRLRRCWPFLLHIAVTGLLMAEFSPLMAVVDRIPMINSVAWLRTFSTIPLCLVACAAVGLSGLKDRRLVLAVLGAMIVSLVVNPDPVVVTLGLMVVAAAVLTVYSRRLGYFALTAILLVDLVPWAYAMTPRGEEHLFYPETAFTKLLVAATTVQGNSRVMGLDYTVYPSILSAYGLEDARYHNPIADLAYARALDATLGFHPESKPYVYFSPVNRTSIMLDFLNVGVIVSAIAPIPDHYVEVFEEKSGSRRAHLNPSVLPRAFLAKDVVAVDRSSTLAALGALDDPRLVVVDTNGAFMPDPIPDDEWKPGVDWSTDSHGKATLRVHGTGSRLVAISLTHPRGWSARSGDRLLRTITINHAFLGVVVPDGTSRVELEFVPPGFRTGVVFAAIGLAIIASLLLTTARRRSH